jgi:rare lipoprotein A
MNTTTRKARRDSDQIAIHTLDPDHTRKLADDAKELTIVSVIAALLVGIAIAIFVLIVLPRPADARGFPWFFQHIKPTGNCAGHEVAASFYWSGRRTANGEVFDTNGNTAASRVYPIGTILHVSNPHTGKSLTIRVNDHGPYGIAHQLGVKLDLARGAARRLGMRQTGWVCVS